MARIYEPKKVLWCEYLKAVIRTILYFTVLLDLGCGLFTSGIKPKSRHWFALHWI